MLLININWNFSWKSAGDAPLGNLPARRIGEMRFSIQCNSSRTQVEFKSNWIELNWIDLNWIQLIHTLFRTLTRVSKRPPRAREKQLRLSSISISITITILIFVCISHPFAGTRTLQGDPLVNVDADAVASAGLNCYELATLLLYYSTIPECRWVQMQDSQVSWMCGGQGINGELQLEVVASIRTRESANQRISQFNVKCKTHGNEHI